MLEKQLPPCLGGEQAKLYAGRAWCRQGTRTLAPARCPAVLQQAVAGNASWRMFLLGTSPTCVPLGVLVVAQVRATRADQHAVLGAFRVQLRAQLVHQGQGRAASAVRVWAAVVLRQPR